MLQSSQPCPWMERSAEEVLEEAEVRLGEALWVARRTVNSGVGRCLAPAVWRHLQGAIGAVLDFGAERIETARYWAEPPPHPGTTPAPGPSTSQEPVSAACPICFEQATQILRPCGHVICVTCLGRIGRCPICKAGFSHSLNIYFN